MFSPTIAEGSGSVIILLVQNPVSTPPLFPLVPLQTLLLGPDGHCPLEAFEGGPSLLHPLHHLLIHPAHRGGGGEETTDEQYVVHSDDMPRSLRIQQTSYSLPLAFIMAKMVERGECLILNYS